MVKNRFIKLISKTTLVVVFLIFTSFFNTVKAQYCLAPNSNLQIFPTNVAQVTPAYISGSARAFNFNATAGCSYYFATCGLAGGGDTFLRVYSLANGGTLLASWDDQCGTESAGTWVCPSTGAYSVLLTQYACSPLSQNTSMTYSSNCGCLLLAPTSVSGSTICQAGTTLISATPTSGANTIRWYNFSSGGTLLFTGINYQPNFICCLSTTYYAASFNSTSGCESSSRTPVTVTFGSVTAPISVLGSTVCQAGTTLISATPESGANTIRWYDVSSGGTLLYTGINYQPNVSATNTYYAASYNSTNGCESLSRFPVDLVVHPNPTISYSTTNSKNGENFAIEVIIKEGAGPYLFDWNFDGEGDFDDLQNQSSLAPGNYILVVKDNNGCKATAFILIESDYNLSIATGISPNNDGKNDKWIILGTKQFDDLEISIYDIFGQCINRQAKNYVPWDGYYNGTLVPEGEYYFIIESVKKKKKITGTILIKY